MRFYTKSKFKTSIDFPSLSLDAHVLVVRKGKSEQVESEVNTL